MLLMLDAIPIAAIFSHALSLALSRSKYKVTPNLPGKLDRTGLFIYLYASRNLSRKLSTSAWNVTLTAISSAGLLTAKTETRDKTYYESYEYY